MLYLRYERLPKLWKTKYRILYAARDSVGRYMHENPLKLMESNCIYGAEWCLGPKRKDICHCVPDGVSPSISFSLYVFINLT